MFFPIQSFFLVLKVNYFIVVNYAVSPSGLYQHTSVTTEDLGTKLKSDDFVVVYVKEHVQV